MKCLHEAVELLESFLRLDPSRRLILFHWNVLRRQRWISGRSGRCRVQWGDVASDQGKVKTTGAGEEEVLSVERCVGICFHFDVDKLRQALCGYLLVCVAGSFCSSFVYS